MEHHQQQNKRNHKEDTSQKKKRKEVAVFGNYRNYYGYRTFRRPLLNADGANRRCENFEKKNKTLNPNQNPFIFSMEHHQQQNKRNHKEDTSQKKKRKEVAVFGNYRNYYGYRIGQDLDEDPRLKAMKKEWFEGKDCLDIGCNSGVITISIAQKFNCRSILGVDIDDARIQDAYWTLRKAVRSTRAVQAGVAKSTESKNATGIGNHEVPSLKKCTSTDCTESNHVQEANLFDIVSFDKGNFVKNWHPGENTSYDTIICLSVSKWVQLNWGDEGLITLFSKVWRLLSPGGVFILEPQPWSSYYSNRLVSETTRINYQEIKFHPEDFQDILLDKIGFRMVEDITSSASGRKPGFNRPIFAFWK